MKHSYQSNTILNDEIKERKSQLKKINQLTRLTCETCNPGLTQVKIPKSGLNRDNLLEKNKIKTDLI